MLSKRRACQADAAVLAARVSAVLLSSSSSTSLDQAMVYCPACFPCIFPVNSLRVRGHERTSQLCAAGPIGTAQA